MNVDGKVVGRNYIFYAIKKYGKVDYFSFILATQVLEGM